MLKEDATSEKIVDCYLCDSSHSPDNDSNDCGKRLSVWCLFYVFHSVFLAKAYEAPRTAVILLLSYLLTFFVSSVLIYIKKTRVAGCSIYCLVFFSDLICFISSFVRGNGYYILGGIPFCMLGMLLLIVTIKKTRAV